MLRTFQEPTTLKEGPGFYSIESQDHNDESSPSKKRKSTIKIFRFIFQRNTKRKSRNAQSFIRWFSFLVTVTLIRTAHNSFVMTNDCAKLDDENWIDFPRLRDRSSSSDARRRWGSMSRRRRPPLSQHLEDTQIYSFSSGYAVQPPSKPEHNFQANVNCGMENKDPYALHSGSRVLISGILSHPSGIELALAIAKDCGIRSIIGLSSKPSNNLNPDEMARLSFLLRKLPNFQMRWTFPPISENFLSGILQSFQPTHIVHLEESLISPTTFGEETRPTAFTIRNSIDILEKMLRATAIHQSGRDRSPHFVYVTTEGSDRTSAIAKASQWIYPQVVDNFRALYHVHSTHLNLPQIYGPFRGGIPWLNAVQSDTEDSSTPENVDADPPLIHIQDSILAIVSCITQMSSTSILGSSNAKPRLQLHKAGLLAEEMKLMRSTHSGSNSTKKGAPNIAMHSIISWLHQNKYPYRDSSNETRRDGALNYSLAFASSQLSKNRESGISISQRRQDKLFPCDSECSAYAPCQQVSVFSSVKSISQNVTMGCKFVLYVADFSQRLNDLYEFDDDPSFPWPRATLCRIAFVSEKSRLITRLVAMEMQAGKTKFFAENHHPHRSNQQQEDRNISYWNGQLQYKNWTLVWVDDHSNGADGISEPDAILPKIAPGTLFGDSVERAVYIEPKHFRALPPLRVIWYLVRNQLDATPNQQLKMQRVLDREAMITRKEESPLSFPYRHNAFFAHNLLVPENLRLVPKDDFFDTDDPHHHIDDLDAVTKHILAQKGLDEVYEWPRRQLEFYHTVQQMTNGRFQFEWVDTALIIHKLKSDRSRRFRCEWYEEHLFWAGDSTSSSSYPSFGTNRNLEDLGLAFVLGRWRYQGRLVQPVDPTFGDSGYDSRYSSMSTKVWGERMVEDPYSEMTAGGGQDEAGGNHTQCEYYVRIQKPMKSRIQYGQRHLLD